MIKKNECLDLCRTLLSSGVDYFRLGDMRQIQDTDAYPEWEFPQHVIFVLNKAVTTVAVLYQSRILCCHNHVK